MRPSQSELLELSKYVASALTTINRGLTRIQFDEDTWHPGADFVVNGLSGTIPNIDNIAYWFTPLQRVLLALLVQMSKQFDQAGQTFIDLSISSSIVHKWPYTISCAMDIDHSRPHKSEPTDPSLNFQIGIFERSFRTTIRYISRLNKFPVGGELGIL